MSFREIYKAHASSSRSSSFVYFRLRRVRVFRVPAGTTGRIVVGIVVGIVVVIRARRIAFADRVGDGGEVREAFADPSVERAGKLDVSRVHRDPRDKAVQRGRDLGRIIIKRNGCSVAEIVGQHRRIGDGRIGRHFFEQIDLRFDIRDLLAQAFKDRSRQHASGHVLGDGFDLGF